MPTEIRRVHDSQQLATFMEAQSKVLQKLNISGEGTSLDPGSAAETPSAEQEKVSTFKSNWNISKPSVESEEKFGKMSGSMTPVNIADKVVRRHSDDPNSSKRSKFELIKHLTLNSA